MQTHLKHHILLAIEHGRSDLLCISRERCEIVNNFKSQTTLSPLCHPRCPFLFRVAPSHCARTMKTEYRSRCARTENKEKIVAKREEKNGFDRRPMLSNRICHCIKINWGRWWKERWVAGARNANVISIFLLCQLEINWWFSAREGHLFAGQP